MRSSSNVWRVSAKPALSVTARTFAVRRPPASSASSPTISPGPIFANSRSPPVGRRADASSSPAVTTSRRSPLVALVEQHVAFGGPPRERDRRDLGQLRLAQALEQLRAREVRRGAEAHRTISLRLRSITPSAPGSATSIVYSGARRHVEVSSLSGSEATITDVVGPPMSMHQSPSMWP